MIQFTFLQISDLHLGRPFTWLPEALAEQRRADQRDLLFRAVRLAIDKKLGAILVAGDLFDGEVADRETIGRAIECVSQPGCPPVFIAPGNHDCHSRSTFYYDNRRLAAAGLATWPAHVHIFGSPAITAASLPGRDDVTIWGRCVPENVDNDERVLATDRPELAPDRLHVLLLHGSRAGVSLPPGKKTTTPFSDAELLAWGADFAALGHYHKPAVISDDEGVPRGAYAGSPIALAIDETGRRYVNLVTVEHNGLHRRVEVTPFELDRRRLHRIAVAVDGLGSPEALKARVDEAFAAELVSKDDLALVVLTGRSRPRVDLAPQACVDPAKAFWARVDATAVRPDYDLDAYRRGEGRTTEEKFARSLLAELDAENDPERRRVLEEALYYGLDALNTGGVAPGYAFGASAAASAAGGAAASASTPPARTSTTPHKGSAR
jgi:DNA repair exonuclease SbcCD nuclease subunit